MELVPLGTMTARLRKPYLLPKTPSGDRLIYEVESGSFDGERLRGEMHGTSTADWLTIGPDGTATLDVRSVLLTDDGATCSCTTQDGLTSRMASVRRCTRPRCSRPATTATAG